MPVKSGAEFHAENHAKQLIKLGNRVSIFAKKRLFATQARENIDGIDLVRLHGGFRWLEILVRLLTTHLNIDAFYIIGTPSFAVWAVKFAKFFKKPVTLALTINEEIFSNDNWRNRVFKSCDHFVAISHEIERGLISQ
ncbi:MAG: glycosyltransferase [Selenomonadaceae bacterium]|nr:glycosyltransferase [Selenomonadaceae bacterium]